MFVKIISTLTIILRAQAVLEDYKGSEYIVCSLLVRLSSVECLGFLKRVGKGLVEHVKSTLGSAEGHRVWL